MSTQPTHIDNLIAAFLSGNANEDSIRELQSWIAESEEHQQYFFEMSATYHRTKPAEDWRQAFGEFKREVENKKQTNYRWYAAAAAAAVLIGVLFLLPKNNEAVLVATQDKQEQLTLQEGSIATVEINSELRYRRDDKNNKHCYYLKGATSFDIRSNQEVLVFTDQLKIEDIGTEFFVQNYASDSLIIVDVKSGIVKVTDKRDSIRVLEAGERIFYNKKSGIFQDESLPPNKGRDNVFDYQNVPLDIIIQDLNRAFGAEISVSDEIRNCRMTVRFENERLDTILLILSETLQAKVIEKNDRIYIEGNGCY
ncbi:MAG: FecR domain-containing protein [Flavobacteriales bacterium]